MRAFRAAYPTMNLNGAVAEKEMFDADKDQNPGNVCDEFVSLNRSSMNDHFTPYSALIRSK